MQWCIILSVFLAVASGIVKDKKEGTETAVGEAIANANSGIGNKDTLTQVLVSSSTVISTMEKTSTVGDDVIVEADTNASVSQKPNPPRTTYSPPPPNSTELTFPPAETSTTTAETTTTGTSKIVTTTTATTPTDTTKSTATTPKVTTTETTTNTEPPTTPPPCECVCDPCKQPDFKGFSFKPGKCGCCPWPCCCKCVGVSGGDAGPCRHLLDLSFILDDSGSISSGDWVKSKQFFVSVVSTLTNIGTDQFVASIRYSTNASLNWNLNDPETSSKEALTQSILELEQIKGFTNPVEAMEIAINEVFVDGIDNPDAPNAVVIMTDGRANFRLDEIADKAEQLRAKAVPICIGVTNKIDMTELRKICDEDNIFTVVNHDRLNTIIGSIQKKICPTPPVTEKCFCCCTPEQFWGHGGANYYRRW